MIAMTNCEIERLLSAARIGRLCMADLDGRPYAIPLPFCWLDGALYVRVAGVGRKGQVLADNDHVCFEVDTFTDALDEYASVLIEGRLVPVTDLAEKIRVRDVNAAKYQRLRNGHRPGHGRATPPHDVPLRKILVEQLSGRQNDPRTSVSPLAVGA
jgi:nitroimidazol reductase NimA-like FMN-containing flavoprotein (pyridoxamine 5'-phosphate oxidase superfamily)